MKDTWQQWSEKLSTLEQREKLLVFSVGLFLFGYLTIWFVISPLQTSYSNNQQRITNLTNQQQNSERQLVVLKDALSKSYVQELLQQEQSLESELQQINQQLADFSLTYISPEDMALVLQKILRKHKNIQLSRFKINPVEAIYVTSSTPATAQDPQGEEPLAPREVAFYQHTMLIELEGEYFGLLSYLKQIKKIEEKLFIQEFDYQVDEYPTGKLTLTIATVSANDKFIAL
ncbi:type II secretion system protein M [Pseudoalteromonas sp. MMG024]|uniref:type II secretion system protein M n=1 Tax=Pseudoalteromonas sp. MMG024 TaxID=2909980 RepID=UPI001F1A60A8|nr:type II secretion system protein M [Pseudoalteromonas sp. MMG024]MCF6458431.1 type II secretion system protein M [Pseudoalteromonas sp. MMG024]